MAMEFTGCHGGLRGKRVACLGEAFQDAVAKAMFEEDPKEVACTQSLQQRCALDWRSQRCLRLCVIRLLEQHDDLEG